MGWQVSDWISSGALATAVISLGISGVSIWLQFHDRKVPYHVQDYIDQTQAASEIVNSVERFIHARQLAMVELEANVYQPQWAKQQPLDRLKRDAKTARTVVLAFGEFNTVIQNNIRFFNNDDTLDALKLLSDEVANAGVCFTTVASVNHDLEETQLNVFRERIAKNCDGANLPVSLEALKRAEMEAISKMDQERKSRIE